MLFLKCVFAVWESGTSKYAKNTLTGSTKLHQTRGSRPQKFRKIMFFDPKPNIYRRNPGPCKFRLTPRIGMGELGKRCREQDANPSGVQPL